MLTLAGRRALITGGGRGLGRAIAVAFGEAGAEVVVCARREHLLEETASIIRDAGGTVTTIGADITVEEDVQRIREAAGEIDILVNNAAIFATIPMSRAAFDRIPIEEWDRMMTVNLRGTWLASRACIEHMKQRGYGKIITISSGTAIKGSAGRIHYVTSKAGIIGFTRVLAREVGDWGICVNCIAPGSTLSEENPDEGVIRMRTAAKEDRALKRVQTPEDIVGTAIFFAAPESDFVTGQTLVVDGGSAMH
jgi:3-oxoacyl-[acyl-carrier protein] reductase